jgi:hypothetical protein
MIKNDNKNENLNKPESQKEASNKINASELSFQDFIYKLKATLTSSKYLKYKF